MSNVISWKEVIRRRNINDAVNSSSLAADVNMEEVSNDENAHDPVDEKNPVNKDFMENDAGTNFMQEPYLFPSTNQTIVCQVIHG